jgi:hypothetical protein
MSALWAAYALDEPFFAQDHQYLVKILFGYALPVGYIGALDWSLPIVCRQVEHGAQSIIAFHG